MRGHMRLDTVRDYVTAGNYAPGMLNYILENCTPGMLILFLNTHALYSLIVDLTIQNAILNGLD